MATTSMMIEALVQMRHAPSQGSHEHFWLLVERFRAGLVNQAVAILGSTSDAEDVAQESLCEAYEGLGTLDDPAKLGAWLRAINRCNALNFRRKRQREALRVEHAQANAEKPAAQTDLEFVARAVDALAEPFRECVVLRFWEKRGVADIALILGIPEGTVKSRLARADAALFEKLKPLYRPGRKTGRKEAP